jgi:hypothetical protein
MLDDFIAASQRREEAFQILDQPLEEEEAPAADSRFSIHALLGRYHFSSQSCIEIRS